VSSEPLNAELTQAFIWLIAKHTGLEIKERDHASLSEKIALRMSALNLDTPDHYYEFLQSSITDAAQEWFDLSILLTNTDSYFFRDKEQFSLLKHHLLPELIQRKQSDKTLRVCSAGCSSGEEPYSLAMLLKELIPDLDQWNLMILGIDINQTALQKAKLGEYSAWSFRGVSPETKQRYFQIKNNKYYLSSQIKEMVTFQALNLVNEPFPHPKLELKAMDLILCRNVFIYFNLDAIAAVLNKFYHTLQPLGYLLTGHAEVVNQNLSQFQTRIFPQSIVYQRQVDHSAHPTVLIPSYGANSSFTKRTTPGQDTNGFQNEFEKNNLKMQQAALNLLKQLSPDTRLPKLGNLTAAELIAQLETDLNNSDH
jgi:chemotaxis protein methyltransferase CheR